jgi:hypothetical protein
MVLGPITVDLAQTNRREVHIADCSFGLIDLLLEKKWGFDFHLST